MDPEYKATRLCCFITWQMAGVAALAKAAYQSNFWSLFWLRSCFRSSSEFSFAFLVFQVVH